MKFNLYYITSCRKCNFNFAINRDCLHETTFVLDNKNLFTEKKIGAKVLKVKKNIQSFTLNKSLFLIDLRLTCLNIFMINAALGLSIKKKSEMKELL